MEGPMRPVSGLTSQLLRSTVDESTVDERGAGVMSLTGEQMKVLCGGVRSTDAGNLRPGTRLRPARKLVAPKRMTNSPKRLDRPQLVPLCSLFES